MENLASPKVIKDIIKKYGFRFSKSLGQNFLVDGNIVDKIIDMSQVGKDDYVIEIGPGIGTLTQRLCERAKKVVAVEIDNKLIPILQENLREYENFSLIHNDVLKVDINNLIEKEFEGKKAKIVANLPYYITTPIIMGLLEKRSNIESITVMIQKEVAERLNAKPGTKDYGALTLAIQYYSIPKAGFIVSPKCFMPQPNVDSLVTRLDILEKQIVDVKDEKLLFKVIKAAFSQRRKTLINTLINSGLFNVCKDNCKEILLSLSLNENIRGEALTLEQFAKLSEKLSTW